MVQEKIVQCVRKLWINQTNNTSLKCQFKKLENLLAHNGFYNNLQGRFKKSFNDTSEDIIDGTLYRQLYNNDGPLSSPYFLVINEVPFKIRMKKENVILAALWYGNEKPAMGTFLKPLQGS